MNIEVKRVNLREAFTEGVMYIDGHEFCDTIEDKVRTDGIKIKGKTAIPAGTYKVILSYSNRFKKVMPEVLAVKGFSGIRIHPGNSAGDSEGCIIVGKKTSIGYVQRSRETYFKLYDIIEEAIKSNEEITIKITNQ